MMASDTGICNRALQLLGVKRIVALTDDSVAARACNNAYDAVRQAELRRHRWNFATTNASLAADAVPANTLRSNSFTLPSNALKLLAPLAERNVMTRDWVIEGRQIITNEATPLYIRYTRDITDPNIMDPAFRESFSARIAMELCEELTQSNQKYAKAKDAYRDAVSEAKLANGIEVVPEDTPDDTWITSRL